MDQVEVKQDDFGRRLKTCNLSMFSKVTWDGSLLYFEKEWPSACDTKYSVGLKVTVPQRGLEKGRAFWVVDPEKFVQQTSEELDKIKRARDSVLLTKEAI